MTPTTTSLPRLPVTSLITASLMLVGVGYAATMPYQGIVAIDGLGISNADFALILTVGSIIGVLSSVLLGWLSDRIEDRRVLVLGVALVSTLGPALMWFVREPWAFVVMTCVLGPLGGSLYSQTLAFARAYLASRGGQVDFVMTLIRAIFAVSWVITPPFAGWIAATYTVFDPFGVAAIASLCCVAIFLVLLGDPQTAVGAQLFEVDGLVQAALRVSRSLRNLGLRSESHKPQADFFRRPRFWVGLRPRPIFLAKSRRVSA